MDPRTLPTPNVPVRFSLPSQQHQPRGMICSLREIGPFVGLGVTQNSSDHDIKCLTLLARWAYSNATDLLNGESDCVHVIEVGSWCGESSLAILHGMIDQRMRLGGDDFLSICLHCVDTWEGSPTDNSSVAKQLYGHDIHQLWHINTSQCESEILGDQVGVNAHRGESVEVAKGFRLAHADLIYLDAGHDQKSIIQDIRAWYDKLVIGGVFAGHDYGKLFPDVVQVVDSFCQSQGCSPLVIMGSNIWLMIKPGPMKPWTPLATPAS